MRIEDIDRPRVVEGSADEICRDHEWLGLDWDEGPMFQSDHGEAYERALARLEGAGLVEASRGEYPTISTTRRGDQVAVGRIDLGELGIQMPAVVARKPRSRFKPFKKRG